MKGFRFEFRGNVFYHSKDVESYFGTNWPNIKFHADKGDVEEYYNILHSTVTYYGRQVTIADLSFELGINYDALYRRSKRNRREETWTMGKNEYDKWAKKQREKDLSKYQEQFKPVLDGMLNGKTYYMREISRMTGVKGEALRNTLDILSRHYPIYEDFVNGDEKKIIYGINLELWERMQA